MASVIAFMLVTQPGINMVYSNIFLKHYAFTEVSELSWLSKYRLFINNKYYIFMRIVCVFIIYSRILTGGASI